MPASACVCSLCVASVNSADSFKPTADCIAARSFGDRFSVLVF